MRFRSLFIFIVISFATAAWADGGDGCYCAANGYLAYERWQTGTSDGNFSVFVIPYTGPEGISTPTEVRLAALKTSSDPSAVDISCEDDNVSVYLRQGVAVRRFNVNVSNPSEPRLSQVEKVSSQNLQSCSSTIYGNQPEAVDLPSTIRAVSYQLIKDRTMGIDVGGQQVEMYTSRVIEKNMDGYVLDDKVVYEDSFAP